MTAPALMSLLATSSASVSKPPETQNGAVRSLEKRPRSDHLLRCGPPSHPRSRGSHRVWQTECLPMHATRCETPARGSGRSFRIARRRQAHAADLVTGHGITRRVTQATSFAQCRHLRTPGWTPLHPNTFREYAPGSRAVAGWRGHEAQVPAR